MSGRPVPTIAWRGDADGCCALIDQTRLPGELVVLEVRDPAQMWDAIRRLAVRGAPAIGIAAAFGLYLGARRAPDDEDGLRAEVDRVARYLASARPTAVNLEWALARMRAELDRNRGAGASALKAILLAAAQRILEEDRAVCRRLGEVGAALVRDGDRILTHCNAGGLATAEYGTALAVVYEARARGRRIAVFADETRPLLQGARLTAWELMQAGIDVTLICDNTAAQVMKEGRIDRVFVGADRIARNGDAANKIGTYGVAVLARSHRIPFYVVAPCSTFDLGTPDGSAIPIEQRPPEEVSEGFGVRTAPEGVKVYSPAFDVTPAELITGIVTERGIIEPVDETAVVRMVAGA